VPPRLETPRVIGEIFQVKPDDNEPLVWDIAVKPVSDLAALTNVAVIITSSLESEK